MLPDNLKQLGDHIHPISELRSLTADHGLKGDNNASELPKTKGYLMKTQMVLIRNEQDADYGLISDVTESAFETIEISNPTERFIIEALRSAQALTISLVAEVNDRVVGHIAFSPVTMSNGTKDW